MLQPTVTTKLGRAELAYWLREGWKSIYGEYPKDASWGILWSQTALECGGGSACRNYNYGNIKRRDGYDYCMYYCSEYINGQHLKFYPPHPQTHFVSCPSALEGARFYIGFLSQRSRYKRAWDEVHKGNVVQYVYWLKQGGYFTAPLDAYTAVVVNLYKEFQCNTKKWKEWKPIPPKITPAPPPEIPSEPIADKPEEKLEPVKKQIPNLPTVIINEPTEMVSDNVTKSTFSLLLIRIIAFITSLFAKIFR